MKVKLFGTLLVANRLCDSLPQQASVDEKEIDELRAYVTRLENRAQEKMKLMAARNDHSTKFNAERRLAAYAEPVRRLETTINEIRNCSTTLFLLICGALVMVMQAGFAILEAGSVAQKNSGMVLLKNLIDVCVGTLAWYFLGFGIAYGVKEDPSKFTGGSKFAAASFLKTDSEDGIAGTTAFRDWFFQWAFCATAATIVSGGVTERMALPCYIWYSIIMTGIIYPFVVYWTWSGQGWLTIGSGEDADNADGYSDFAGSGIVHLVGGIGALTGAAVLGPRKGRWEHPEDFKPSNAHLVVLGTFILWFGWYGFNCGSQLRMESEADATAAALVAMNSTLAAAAGGLVVFTLRLAQSGAKGPVEYDLCGMCNGILAGLVAICAGVNAVEPSMAIATGALGGAFQELGHLSLAAIGIDDPLDAFAVHGCGGICGLLTRPLFDWRGVKTTMFGWHCLGIVVIAAWVAAWSLVVWLPLKVTGLLRISDEEEKIGEDVHLVHSPVKLYVPSELAEEPVQEFQVRINVYDMVQDRKNELLEAVAGGGIYHSGVEIDGSEYAFSEILTKDGKRVLSKKSGVFTQKPRQLGDDFTHATFKTSIHVGSLKTTLPDLNKRIQKVKRDRKNLAMNYDMLTNNCNHFTARMCKALDVDAPPDWINMLAEKSSEVVDAWGAVSDAITDSPKRISAAVTWALQPPAQIDDTLEELKREETYV